MAKEFAFHGKTADELKKMGLNEVAKLFPARQRRSLARGFTGEQKKFLTKVEQGKKNLKTHCRDLIIVPQLIGSEIKVHTGKEWAVVRITPEMLGHYVGEFTQTRKPVKHSGPGVGATRGSKHQSVK